MNTQKMHAKFENKKILDTSSLIFFQIIYLFVYFWLLWAFNAAHFSLVAVSGGYSVVLRRLLIAVAFLAAEYGSEAFMLLQL